MLTTHNIDIQAMLVWLTLPLYDFCGFRSVAVNTVYKLQFFCIYIVLVIFRQQKRFMLVQNAQTSVTTLAQIQLSGLELVYTNWRFTTKGDEDPTKMSVSRLN